MKVPYYIQYTFEWDYLKNQINSYKHKVSFEEAQVAFTDKNRLILTDSDHSTKTEQRFYCIGKIQEKICTVRYSKRNGKIRIIGAGYWRKEAKLYEKINQK